MRDTLERVEVVIESKIQTIYAHWISLSPLFLLEYTAQATRKASSFKVMGLKFARAVAPVLSSSHIMLSLLPPHINSSISQIPSPALVLTSFAVNALKCMLAKLTKPLETASATTGQQLRRRRDPGHFLSTCHDFRDGGSSLEHCPPNKLCMLAKMPISRWGMCSSTSRNLMEDKHWGESGCQANQQQSCRFLKGLSSRQGMCSPTPRKLIVRWPSPGPCHGSLGAGGPGRHGHRGRGGRRAPNSPIKVLCTTKYSGWLCICTICGLLICRGW